MVLSGTKRTASIDSITNKPQGGGPNKAGLPYQVGRDHWFQISLVDHQTRNTLYDFKRNGSVVFGLRHTMNPHVHQSRPVGSWTNGNVYWNMPGASHSFHSFPI